MSPIALENEGGQWLSLSRARIFLAQFLGKLCRVAGVSDGHGGDGLIILRNRKLAASFFDAESSDLMHHQSRHRCLKREIGDGLTRSEERRVGKECRSRW